MGKPLAYLTLTDRGATLAYHLYDVANNLLWNTRSNPDEASIAAARERLRAWNARTGNGFKIVLKQAEEAAA